MVQLTRTRERIYRAGTAGFRQARNGKTEIAFNSYTMPFDKETCVDDVGERFNPAHKLLVERTHSLSTPFDGECAAGFSQSAPGLNYKFHQIDCLPIDGVGNVGISHLPFSFKAIDPVNIVARTNPSRPVLDAGVFIGELRDLPDMFRQLASLPKAIRNIASSSPPKVMDRAAHEYLGYEFGWKPLLSDINNAIRANEHIQKRMGELMRLHSNGGLRRKLTIEKTELSASGREARVPWFNVSVSDPYETHTYVKHWVTVRWLPDPPPFWSPLNYSPDLQKQARAAVFGLIPDASTAWELMPWSWLADWFSNVGDILSARRNIVGAHHGVVHQMQELVTEKRWRAVNYGNAGFKGQLPSWQITRYTRSRAVFDPSYIPQANLPLLTGRQLSILSAIGWTRR